MKKIILSFAFVALLLSSCDPNCCMDSAVYVDKTTLTFPCTTGSEGISIASSVTWTVISHPDWVTVTPMEGSGKTSVTINYDENTGADPRQGKIIIKASNGDVREITVKQSGVAFTVNPDAIYVSASGDASLPVTVNSGSSWAILDQSSIPAWIIPSALTGSATGGITIKIDTNSGLTPRSYTLVFRRANGDQATLLVVQYIDPDKLLGGGTAVGNRTYVGAFWKSDQVGERIIRINHTGGWTAQVAWYDSEWNPATGDGIVLALGGSSDPNVDYTTVKTPGDAENYVVSGDASSISGTGNILFRIGLNLPFAKYHADSKPARYALVTITHTGGNQKLFIRQGDGADYVMRKEDQLNSSDRSYVAKWSPYNILPSGGVFNTQITYRSGVFAPYPTYAGALFQWGALGVSERYAWDPSVHFPVFWNNSWSDQYWKETKPLDLSFIPLYTILEICPDGYRRPQDGPVITWSDGLVSESEVRQSLLLKPLDADQSPGYWGGYPGGFPSVENSVFGYYADGYFDRRMIVDGIGENAGTNSTVSYNSGSIAHIGRLFYNLTTQASLFFPFAGLRDEVVGGIGELTDSGRLGYYLISSKSYRNLPYHLYLSDTYANINVDDCAEAMSIRCVRE